MSTLPGHATHPVPDDGASTPATVSTATRGGLARFRDFVLRKVLGMYLNVPHPTVGTPNALAAYTPPAPDYSRPEHWAALPGHPSAAYISVPTAFADVDNVAASPPLAVSIPPLFPASSPPAPEAEDHVVDCFYVYPTVYFGRGWCAHVDDPDFRRRTEVVLAVQASAFGETCRVYAPHYRQMTFGGFVFDQKGGRVAMELAYSDVFGAPFVTFWSTTAGNAHLCLRRTRRAVCISTA